MGDGVECPTCGDCFKNRNRLGPHHRSAHGVALKKAEAPQGEYGCPGCDAQFESKHGLKVHYGHSHAGSLAFETHECGWCGSTFDRRTWRDRDGQEKHFCSTDCRNKHQTETKPHNYVGNTVQCSNCGEKIEKRPSKVEASKDNFCSLECMGEAWEGSGSVRWKDGHREYGPGWNESKKRSVRERDGFQCQDCGMSQEEHVSICGRRLHVHHIIPARKFDDASLRNAPDNLVTLCQKCHNGKWDHIPGLRPDTTTAAD